MLTAHKQLAFVSLTAVCSLLCAIGIFCAAIVGNTQTAITVSDIFRSLLLLPACVGWLSLSSTFRKLRKFCGPLHGRNG